HDLTSHQALAIFSRSTSPPIFYLSLFFFFTDTATPEIYTLSLHDALPISKYLSPAIPILLGTNSARRFRTTKTPSVSFRVCPGRSEEHTSELQSLRHLVCRLLLEKKKNTSTLRKRFTHLLQLRRPWPCPDT